jgi:DNA polymerase V
LKTKIEDIWGIGRRTSLFLKDKKIITAKDFVDKDIAWVRENLSKPYEIIWHELRGKSIMLVDPEPKMEYSSIQKTLTFHPITNNRYFLLSQLSKHTEDACRKARHFGLVPRRISFFLKTQDFVFYPFDFPLPIPTNSPEVILSFIKKYFDRVWKKGVLYRTAGVTLLGLVPESSKQLGLFDTSGLQDKFESIHKQIDLLEEKLEKRVVFLGSTIKHTRGFN